jgi:hypothetical protein
MKSTSNQKAFSGLARPERKVGVALEQTLQIRIGSIASEELPELVT